MTKTKALYGIWSGMKDRCYNPKNPHYNDYGGRNIKVCDRWRANYNNFESDVGQRPNSRYELDRINKDGDYSPENVRWVMHSENTAYNKRRVRRDNQVGCAGVYYDKKRDRYHATITVHTRRIHLGRYCSKSMAIRVRRNAEEMFVGFL